VIEDRLKEYEILVVYAYKIIQRDEHVISGWQYSCTVAWIDESSMGS
jgi:hypothetical protein